MSSIATLVGPFTVELVWGANRVKLGSTCFGDARSALSCECLCGSGLASPISGHQDMAEQKAYCSMIKVFFVSKG
jgi:hypothetical protein